MVANDADARARISGISEAMLAGMDVASIVDRLGSQKETFVNDVRERVREDLLAVPPRTAWAVSTLKADGSTQETFFMSEAKYYVVLGHLLLNRRYRGQEVQSRIVPVVLSSVERAIEEFYGKPEVAQLLAKAVAQQLAAQRIGDHVVGEVSGNIVFDLQEVVDAAVDQPSRTVVIDRVLEYLHDQMTSAGGQEVAALIGKLMGTSFGHALVAKLGTAIGVAASSSAVHSTIAMAVKKVGIMALLKTTVGKLLILALFGAAGLPEPVLLITVLAVVLPWQYGKLPGKLAAKIPDQVADLLDGRYAELQSTILKALLRGALERAIWTVLSDVMKPNS